MANDKNGMLKHADWFVVVGYRGEEPQPGNCEFITVQAESLEDALRRAQVQAPGITAASALRESDLRGYLSMIEAAKQARI